jgi:hypothetical protein
MSERGNRAGGAALAQSLPVINLAEARFECTFGRGCDGLCCQTSRPPIYPEEEACLDANVERFLPELRPEARAVVEKQGYLSNKRKLGLPILRVVDGWCVFFNQGCVLHKAGAAEGDKNRYKPVVCALFPLEKDDHDQWYVRQKGFRNDPWDLFCLDPASSQVPAAESLKEELELAQRCSVEEVT